MHDFYAFMGRMKYIRRWSLMRSVAEENIMEHSQQVAVFAHALAVIKNRIFGGGVNAEKAAMYALYHESAEVITGDLPTPIKYFNADINSAYKNLEDIACEKLLAMLPENIREDYEGYMLPDKNCYEYKIMKFADKLSAYVKCLEELKSGNGEFKKAKQSIEKELRNFKAEEVDYFLDNFSSGFSKSLDELDG